MTQPRLFTIDRSEAGPLSTMAAPPGHEQLSPFLSALREQGVDVLVSLLPPREEARLGLTSEEQEAAEVGMEFLRLATRDFGAPGLEATKVVASDVCQRLAGDQHVVIHCRGGVGRSSTLAAAVLVAEGLSPDEAWRLISAARGTQVPETRGQRNLIMRLAAANDLSTGHQPG